MSKKIISVVVIGNQFVGKTSLTSRYCKNLFNENYAGTVGIDFLNKIIKIGNQEIEVRIWDSAGSERFQTLTTQYIRRAQAAILVFDLTDKSSFDNINNWKNKLSELKNIPIILVGNKSDLTEKKQMNLDEVEEFANENRMKFFKVSAKTGENVNNCFEELVMMYLGIKKEEEEVDRDCIILPNPNENEKGKKPKKKNCCK